MCGEGEGEAEHVRAGPSAFSWRLEGHGGPGQGSHVWLFALETSPLGPLPTHEDPIASLFSEYEHTAVRAHPSMLQHLSPTMCAELRPRGLRSVKHQHFYTWSLSNFRTFSLSVVLPGKSDSSALVTGVSLVPPHGANEPACGVERGRQRAQALRDQRPRPGLLSFAPCAVKGTGMNQQKQVTRTKTTITPLRKKESVLKTSDLVAVFMNEQGEN